MKILTINTKHYRFQTKHLSLEEAIHEAAAHQEKGIKKKIRLGRKILDNGTESIRFDGLINRQNSAYLAVLYLLILRPELNITICLEPIINFKPEDEAAIVSYLLDYP